MQTIRAGPLLLALLAAAQGAAAPMPPLEIKQDLTLYNLQSSNGVPISSVINNPVGSDGRAPTVEVQAAEGLTTTAPTPKQFRSFVVFGGLAAPRKPLLLNSNLSYVANAANIGLPRAPASGTPQMVFKSALVGAPYMSRAVSFLFGSEIPVPLTDENGTLLNPLVVRPEDYWLAEPYTTNSHANAGYYWSPHAREVFAIQAGQIFVTWKKATPSLTEPADYDTNPEKYLLESGLYYTLYQVRYIVSGSAAKAPRKMYWTEGAFRSTGKPVYVPTGRVGAVNVVYNNNFPERVEHEYVPLGQVPVVETNRLEETRTLWYDQQQGLVYAYNQEGRVFVELLGDTREGGVNREHLGFEIVDVSRQTNPRDVTIELGEILTAYPDGQDDSDLYPDPILQAGMQTFYYRQTIQGQERALFYAVQETKNLNDLLVWWLEEGQVGLRWPLVLARYQLVWPADAAKYSHYIRPLVSSEAEAKETAVPLPNVNAPMIAYQDPLDFPRGKLTEDFKFYTYLEPAYPAHRTLLRFTSGESVAFERVFSWLDANLKAGNFAGTLATNLSAWNTNSQSFSWPNALQAPRVLSQTVYVGDRLSAPGDETGGGSGYWAGHLRPEAGISYNPNAYVDPFVAGFTEANQGAIIPVNAIPGTNLLEVWWFRKNAPDLAKGFQFSYWPSVLGRYTIAWPANSREIVLASNDGSGGLVSLEAKGRIYYQNDPSQPGYNPNEEHALMLAGQAYALRDDLNITSGTGYSSAPFVLVEYTEADGRPAMSAFKVLREKPSAGILFDFLTEAGQILQAPMPLPLLPKPIEGSGPSAVNYNVEPLQQNGDLPVNWNEANHGAGTFAHYKSFTYQDRKGSYWVYRGLHAGAPPLQAGTYNPADQTFTNLPAAKAVVNTFFTNSVHASRLAESLVMSAREDTPLPTWLRINGLALEGKPGPGDIGTNTVWLVTAATDDASKVTNSVVLKVVSSGSVVAQGPLSITSTNAYAGTNVTYVGRPPYLASSPVATNSFTMRFYYKTQEGFAWPGVAAPPAVGAIVPYLRPKNALGQFVGDAASAQTVALDVVYRPYWPYEDKKLGKLKLGDTLTQPKNNCPAIRGQTSVEVLYQQAIALDLAVTNVSAVLHDPTREKSFDISQQNLSKLPAGIRTETLRGKQYFPNLPPHLVERLFFDPNRGSKGHLVFKGQYKDEPVGEKYLLLNVLRGTDLAAAKALCPTGDPDKTAWDQMIDGLSTTLETFRENSAVPGTYIPDPALDRIVGVGDLAEIGDADIAVDSYALSACGPGTGYVTIIAGNGWAFTPEAEPVSVYVLRVLPELYVGELKVIAAANPLNEQVSFQHTADLAGRFDEYEYEWKIGPPIDGREPDVTPAMLDWTDLATGVGLPIYTLGGAGIQVLCDNYLVLRYRPINPAHPLYNQWSDWTEPQLAEGWIKRVLAGINPFNQRITDLFNNRVSTDVSMLTQAGKRWEGDVALNLENIYNYGLIEIYETVLRRGKMLSIDAGINYGPANDALLLAAGYLDDLYMMLGNEAWADAANPTIGIGTKDTTYGDIATALFSFKGQVASLLDEELALLRGRDDFLQPGVETTPVYNRLVWNYTRGIDAGEVIYALNYNIQEDPNQTSDGIVNADDARRMYPQGHGDAYGHYLTALKGYYSLLMDTDFDWVPRTEAVTVLGKAVQVDYMDERKFAAAAAAVARAGRQVFDLTWRQDYKADKGAGWTHFSATRTNARRGITTTRYWGMDHWASRVGQGALVNWVVGNAILPDVDPDPEHEGIQKIDRTTVPELSELAASGGGLQTAMDNAEAGLSPLGLPQDSLAFDINPMKVIDDDPQTHFEQIYERALVALQNAVAAFDDAKDVTRLMRSQEDSLAEFRAQVAQQEMAYNHRLIELYGSPYPDDIGPGKTYETDYAGPDLLHFMYVDLVEIYFPGIVETTNNRVFNLDFQPYPGGWMTNLYTDLPNIVAGFGVDNAYSNGVHYIEYTLGPHGFFEKPATWQSKRKSPGKTQQAISDIIKARNALYTALNDHEGHKCDLDKKLQLLAHAAETWTDTRWAQRGLLIAKEALSWVKFASECYDKVEEFTKEDIKWTTDALGKMPPTSLIAGVASGGDLTSAARSMIEMQGMTVTSALEGAKLAKWIATQVLSVSVDSAERWTQFEFIEAEKHDQEVKDKVFDISNELWDMQVSLFTINGKLQELDDARRSYQAVLAEGDRIQEEREISRRRQSAIIQGYRTRDAAFRIFRNEKLERYKTLFDMAAQYALLAANAYDYETGLLHTDQGKAFISRIICSRALGVVRGGVPQYAGSDTGDPGLSSALAEMKADWDVLRGRLGFNNPDAYGTTVSLRTENLRILPGMDGNENWRDALQQGRRDNLLDDADIRRYCMQLSRGEGLPVPGIVLEFSTTISDGLNLFGRSLAAGDHAFSPSSFATKVFAVGVVFEGYQGMDGPAANSSAVGSAGGSSPSDPSLAFLDPKALAATPYVYLIPVGLDSMRIPPLGDASGIRTWSVSDVTIPLPFNIGASDFSTMQFWQSSDSLSEPLFAPRKHQAFRPVATTEVFNLDIHWQLMMSQFTNRRLIGRSVWNSKWKLVIPGHTLLNDPNEGLDRFTQTVTDVKLHFVTYSYAGN
jgi:hypothetical protein